MNKYFKIAAGIITILAVAAIGYAIWLKKATPAGQETAALGENAGNLPAATGSTGKQVSLPVTVSQGSVFGYWIDADAVYYLNESGQVIKITSGKEEVINSQRLNGLHSVYPSPNGKSAIVEFNYPEQPSFSLFSITRNAWQPLPPAAIAAAWDPSSSRIAYLEKKSGGGVLKIMDAASKKSSEIIPLAQMDVHLQWIKADELLITMGTPSVNMPGSLWKLNIKTKALTPIIKNENGLVTTWSPEGDLGLKLSSLNRKPGIALIENTGNILTALSFVTVPEKCTLAARNVYCAVPAHIASGMLLPDDYYKKSALFQDNLYLFNLADGSVSLLMDSNTNPINAEQLRIQGNALFFINRYDSRMYKLAL